MCSSTNTDRLSQIAGPDTCLHALFHLLLKGGLGTFPIRLAFLITQFLPCRAGSSNTLLGHFAIERKGSHSFWNQSTRDSRFQLGRLLHFLLAMLGILFRAWLLPPRRHCPGWGFHTPMDNFDSVLYATAVCNSISCQVQSLPAYAVPLPSANLSVPNCLNPFPSGASNFPNSAD